MPGPMIDAKDWERIKVAGKEMEAKETIKEVQPVDRVPEKTKRIRAPRLSVVLIGVLAVLAVVTASLWIDSQARLMSAASDIGDSRSRIDLLQQKNKKLEDEKQRLTEENTTLSTQYEQTAAELARLEDELNALRSQKGKSKVKVKQNAVAVENGSDSTPAGAKAAHESAREEKDNTPKPQKQDQQNIKDRLRQDRSEQAL